MRAVAYIRVSDPSQVEGHSLDAQERLFHELCKTRGWIPGRTYREEGRSARHESIKKRPLFRQLLEEASQGQFDVVVVHTLDRWARNLKVLLESVSILIQHNVALVSITENLDWSTAEGRLVARSLGSFGEFFSDMLATHVKKGITERARQGFHLGGIPFGYQSCWKEEHGLRQRRCDPEHPGGVHTHPQEGPAVKELFRRYAAGTTTLSQLACWLNNEGFRTRNMHKLLETLRETSLPAPAVHGSFSQRYPT
jgi:site-specific DNA recombinase